MTLFAFGAKFGMPVTGIAASSSPLNNPGTRSDPSATLPSPRLNFPRKWRRLTFSLLSRNSFISALCFLFGNGFVHIVHRRNHLCQRSGCREVRHLHMFVFAHVQFLLCLFWFA